MTNNILNLLSEDTFIEKMDTQNTLLAAIASNAGGIVVSTWRDVQCVVRLGLASKVFQIGDQLVCNKGGKQLVWDIIGFDHDIPADNQFNHSMTIQLHDTLPLARQFDGTEALFYCETELAAGTYNFTLLAGYDTTYGGGKTYQFTLTKAVPAGGVIMFPWEDQKQASTILISTYESRTATTAIESTAVSAGNDGAALETIGECNQTSYIRYGSNSWKNSAIRQFLNSSGAAGTFWVPQTKFDRPPSWNEDTAGFLNDLDEDFLAVIGDVTKRTMFKDASNTVNYEDTKERFFLISRSEAYAGNENGIEEGSPYEYYSLNSELEVPGTGVDNNRIKYKNKFASNWTLRSVFENNQGRIVRLIGPGGGLIQGKPFANNGISPACNIV